MMLELQLVKIPETNKVIISYLTHDSKYVLYFYQVWLHCKEMQSGEDYFEFHLKHWIVSVEFFQ